MTEEVELAEVFIYFGILYSVCFCIGTNLLEELLTQVYMASYARRLESLLISL